MGGCTENDKQNATATGAEPTRAETTHGGGRGGAIAATPTGAETTGAESTAANVTEGIRALLANLLGPIVCYVRVLRTYLSMDVSHVHMAST